MESGPSSCDAAHRNARPERKPLDRPRHLKERLEAEATGIPFLYWLDDDASNALLMLPPDRASVTVGRRESKSDIR